MAEAKKKPAAKKPAAKKAAPAKKPAPKKSAPAKNPAPKKSAPAKKKPAAKKNAKPVKKSWGKMTIAERTAFRKRYGRMIMAILSMTVLLAAAGFFRFCVAGYSFSAALCAGTAFFIGFFTFSKSRKVVRLISFLLTLVIIAACVTEAFIIKASFGSADTDCDYLIVLGAKVRSDGPSLSLNDRVEAAAEYLAKHPNTVAVVSGGQGPDEPMTEAKAMYEGLVARGIAPSRIWQEDKAASTWENLQFSLNIIEEKTGRRPETVAVVSSEYHLFRAGLFTKAAGAGFIGIPAQTSIASLKINYFLREVAGVWHYYLLGGQYHD